jgi:hypothetical protein
VVAPFAKSAAAWCRKLCHEFGAAAGSLACRDDAAVRIRHFADERVTGAPDDRTGEAIHAFVVPARGRTPDRAALASSCVPRWGDANVPAPSR